MGQNQKLHCDPPLKVFAGLGLLGGRDGHQRIHQRIVHQARYKQEQLPLEGQLPSQELEEEQLSASSSEGICSAVPELL